MSFTKQPSLYSPPPGNRCQENRSVTIYRPDGYSGWLAGVLVDVQGDVMQATLFTHDPQSPQSTDAVKAGFREASHFFSERNGALGIIPGSDEFSITFNCGPGSQIDRVLVLARVPEDMREAIMKEVASSWRNLPGHAGRIKQRPIVERRRQ